MIREAIEKLIELSHGKILDSHGLAYSTQALNPLPSPSAQPRAVELNTLSGLVVYAEAKLDQDSKKSGDFFVVHGPAQVSLVSSTYGNFAQRDTYATAKPFLANTSTLGSFTDLEAMIIALQSSFVQDESTAALMKFLGSIQGTSVASVADDGVSQSVEVRRGITGRAGATAPSMVSLRPYRTFQEIEQPASRYVLRLRGDGDKAPTVAMFVCGDEQWRLAAVQSIAAYLSHNTKIPVVF